MYRRRAREFVSTPSEPANAALAGVARGRGVACPGDDVVELHDDVGAEIALDLDDELRGEPAARSIEVAAKLDPVFVDGAQRRQGEDLKSAGVREYGPVPIHEAVQSSHRTH